MARDYRMRDYVISTDKGRLDLKVIHDFLSRSYWAEGIPVKTVLRSIENSLTFGIYKNDRQVGFARVITDYATFAYIADVFIDEYHRGQGLGKWLIEVITSHPELQGLRRWMLVTRDAHELYSKVGFTRVKNPDNLMEIRNPDVYKNLEMEFEDTHYFHFVI